MYQAMNMIELETEPAGNFEEINATQDGWEQKISRLIQQGQGIKYDRYNFPNIPKHIADDLSRHGYLDGFLGDIHFLIPKKLK